MIGIFDSGLGGLSALKEARQLLPSADIVYFGDTGRVPYGSRSRETIIKYALQDISFLRSRRVDAVLVACGTVSSNAMEALRRHCPDLPIVGVIESGARRAAAATQNGRIGISGTAATIASGAYERELLRLDPSLKLLSTPCPLFVPLVENGFIDPEDEVTRLVADRYLSEMRRAEVDTLILGCTHYPIISGAIGRVLPGVTLIDVAAAAAAELRDIIDRKPGVGQGSGKTEYFVSDEPHDFAKIASIFLKQEITDAVTQIDIEKY